MDAAVHEVKDHGLAMLRAQLPDSRALLALWLRLYQVHSATLESGILTARDVLAELARLRAEEGLVIGLSVSGPQQSEVIRAALEVRIDGINPFACVQATWNLLEPSAQAALEDAHAAGWGVIVKEVLANGRLLGAEAPVRDLDAVAERTGETRDALAIAAALRHDWVDVVLSGAATPEQLRSNVRGASLVLSDDDAAELSAMGEPAEAYWRARAARAWV